MAEKKILIDIEVKNTAAVTAVANLQTEIKKLRKEQGDLDRSTEEGAKQFAIMGAQIKALTKEQQAHEKTIQNEIKAQNALEGSNDKLKAQLSLLVAEQAKLSEAQQNTEGGKALAKSILDINNKLKESEGSMGNFRRNVGDYAKGGEAMASAFGKVPGPIGEMARGVGGASNAMKAFNLTNPMGWITILVGLITSLTSKFKGNEEQTARLNAVFAPLKQLADQTTRNFEKLIDVFIKGAEVMSKVTNAFLDFLGVSKEVNGNSETYIQLEKDKQKQIERTRDLSLELAKGELEVSELKAKIARKDLYTLDERRRMNQEAIDIERRLANERKANADENLRILEEESKLTKNSAEINEKLAQAKVAVINAEREYNDNIRRLSTQASAFEIEAENDKKKAREDAEKARAKILADREKAEAKRIADEEKAKAKEEKRIADKLKSDITALNKSLEAYKLNQEEMKLTKEFTNTEMLEMDRELATKETETRLAVLEKRKEVEKDNAKEIEAEIENVKKAGANKLLAIDKQASEKRKAQELANAQERADIELMLAEGNIDAVALLKMQALEKERLEAIANAEGNAEMIYLINQKYAKLEQDLNAETAQKKLDAVMQWAYMSEQAFAGLNQIVNNFQQQELMDYEEGEMKKKESLDARLAAGQISQEQHAASVKAIERDLDKERKKIALEQAKRQKALTILSIILDTAKAIAEALPNIPLSFAAGSLGAIQLGVASSAPLPKASRGKLLKGKSHAQGGIPIEGEDGEAIINKKSTQMFGGLLSEINQAGGGVAFSSGDGGYGMRTGGIGLTAQEVEDAMTRAVEKLVVEVSVVDIIMGTFKHRKLLSAAVY
jgi:hypothetical protein